MKVKIERKGRVVMVYHMINNVWKLVKVTCALLVVLGCSNSYAYTHKDIINAIIGEAEGESQKGKDAVACAIINRGSLHGVYGGKAIIIKEGKYCRKTKHGLRYISNKIVMEAELADNRAISASSYCSDLIGEATGWGSSSDVATFRNSLWFSSVLFTAHIGNHYFYSTNN